MKVRRIKNASQAREARRLAYDRLDRPMGLSLHFADGRVLKVTAVFSHHNRDGMREWIVNTPLPLFLPMTKMRVQCIPERTVIRVLT